MAATTSYERREVAETMRVISGEGVSDLTLGEVLNSILTGGAPRPTTEVAIIACLADLIDPTCEVVPFDEESMRLPHCSVCMQPILKPWPNFCPNCGARVTGGGDA